MCLATVYKENDELVGVAALHIIWEGLAEVRSVAVSQSSQRKGVATKLVKACIEEAKELGLDKVFCLTYRPDFFGTLGFTLVDKSVLPHKVWRDCINCPKFPDCDENAMIYEIK